jgi:hypothetical protein
MPPGPKRGMMRPMARVVLIAALALLALAPTASAAPPSLVSVTQSGGKIAASWTLPAGGQAWTIEVSKTSGVDSDGYFDSDDVVDTQIFVDGTTSWTSDVVLPAGTYYVHLSGADVRCTTCPVPEWSTVRSVTVGGGASSGGSGGSGGSTGSSSGSGTSAGSGTSSGSSDTGSNAGSGSTGGTSSGPATSTPQTAAYGTVSRATARLKGNLATISFSVCGSGTVDVTVVVARGKAQHVSVVTLPLDGCTSYALRLSAPAGSGKPTVSVGTGGVGKQL